MRSFKSHFDYPFLRKYQDGVMAYQYKGIQCLRSPIDAAIQARAIWDLEPATIIEIGSVARQGWGASISPANPPMIKIITMGN